MFKARYLKYLCWDVSVIMYPELQTFYIAPDLTSEPQGTGSVSIIKTDDYLIITNGEVVLDCVCGGIDKNESNVLELSICMLY